MTTLLFILNKLNIIPTHTEAAILVEQKKPLIVDKIELPKNLALGQILVEVLASGICGSQIGEINGIKGPDPFLPHLMGHEGCGKVLKVGPGVKTVKVDDIVVLHWRKGSGIESEPPKYIWRGLSLNAGWVTTFNKHAVISENRCTTIPSDVKPELAALYGCAVTTGFGVVENNANIRIGESIVVFGAGGIGLNIIQAAKMKSAYPIIAVDIHNNRLNLANKIGATHCINSKNVNVEEEIQNILGDNNLDVFVDNTGITKIIELGYKIIKFDGKMILVGVPKKGENISIFSLPLHFGKVIVGSHGGESVPDKDILRYMNLMRNSLLDLSLIISSRYKLSQINEAIDDMSKGNVAGRIIIDL